MNIPIVANDLGNTLRIHDKISLSDISSEITGFPGNFTSGKSINIFNDAYSTTSSAMSHNLTYCLSFTGEKMMQFKHENFHFSNRKQAIPLNNMFKTNSLFRLTVRSCEDNFNLINIRMDSRVLKFSMTCFVTCQGLKGGLVPRGLRNITEVTKFIDSDRGKNFPLLSFDTVENMKLIIIDYEHSHFNFNVPEGLALRFKKLQESNVLFGLYHNEVSDQLLKQVLENVVSRIIVKTLDAYLENDSLIYTQFTNFTDNLGLNSAEEARKSILEMLVKDRIRDFERNIRNFLVSFFEGSIYLQKEENSTESSAYDIFLQHSEMGNNLIIRSTLNHERDRVWALDLASIHADYI
ncbi:15568_t:CDS:1 [Acaulospora morrowiae]|uniref:15568_t:CDS:1 n=1 Tax=Acaulospora morrowiae TaxID=94023 RepID=A0A9N8WAJ1_9GLOM|nr:15568_t:CDS:1 [Acaulospora morrowiae]